MCKYSLISLVLISFSIVSKAAAIPMDADQAVPDAIQNAPYQSAGSKSESLKKDPTSSGISEDIIINLRRIRCGENEGGFLKM
jgi:hypothetical protein